MKRANEHSPTLTAFVILLVLLGLSGHEGAGASSPAPEVTVARLGNLFSRGEPIEIQVRSATAQDIALEVTRRLTPGVAPVFRGRFRVPTSSARITLPLDTARLPNGLYALAVNSKTVMQFGLVAPDAARAGALPLLGVSLYDLDDSLLQQGEQVAGLLRRLGIRATLVTIDWSAVEQRKGRYQWEHTDRLITVLHDAGVQIIGQIAWTPRWASRGAGDTEGEGSTDLVPGWMRYPPKELADWERFLGLAAARYRGRVNAIEIWNEPDIDDFYRGSVEEFIQMVKAAARAVRRSASGTKVLVSGFVAVNETLPFVKAVWEATVRDFDVASLHYQSVNRSLDIAGPFLRSLDPAKPIWNTEEGGTGFLDFEGTVGNPIKNIVESLAAGMDHIIIFLFAPSGSFKTAIVDSQNHVTERALWFRTAVDILTGAQFLEKEARDGLHRYTFRKGNGQLVVAWAAHGGAELALERAPRRIIDAWGNDVPVTGRVVRLGPSPVFLQMD